MNEKLAEALDHISDRKISDAARARKRRPYWIGAVAALLAIVLLVVPTAEPAVIHASAAQLLAEPEYPEMAPFPDESKFYESNDWDAFYAEHEAWWDDRKAQRDQPEGYADSLESYFLKSIPELLDSGKDNAVCSPLNIYMALAMLAETTGSTSRQQILELLRADSIETLREQAGSVWNAHYLNDGASASILANSLWLDEGLQYNKETIQTLADSYYASAYQGELGSEEVNEDLRHWLNEQTGGLLEDQVQNAGLNPDTVLALASTIYYRAKWSSEFSESSNTQGKFHGTRGSTDVTYMNTTLNYGPYYWGEDYGAAYLNLDDGSRMWLILPDEGKSPADVLENSEVLEMVLAGGSGHENQMALKINLSLPKFDIVQDRKINQQLQALGITEVFDKNRADFSAVLPEDDAYLNTVQHAARVKIDEKGLEAAAYTLMMADATGGPMERNEIDFILDRPFVFVITSHDNLPLFAGVVNEP